MMDNEFFEPSSGGDASFQHIIWFLGHPSVWLTFFFWVLIFIAVAKIAKRLKSANKTQWMMLFLIAVATAVIGYAWLSVNAFQFYAEGLGRELSGLRYAKFAIKILSILSGFWIAIDLIKARR